LIYLGRRHIADVNASLKKTIVIVFEGRDSLLALNHDEIVVLILKAGTEKLAAPVRSKVPSIW